jgi:hypothetical protein
LQCVTWPDGSVTQTFDPQSPPCIATWPGAAHGNGGSTAKGVSGTAIRVAIPVVGSNSKLADFQVFADFLNTRFELYGRKLQLVPYRSAQLATKSYNDPSSQHADAVQTGSLNAFASLDFLDGGPIDSALPTWYDTLKAEGVIAVMGGAFAVNGTQASLERNAPYAWSYGATVDTLLAQTGINACRQLVGRNAVHAPAYAGQKRTFALVLPDQSVFGGPVPGVSHLLSVLAGCGVKNPTVVYADATKEHAAELSAAMAKLKTQGVSTIMYLPWAPAGEFRPMQAAQAANYFPEWDVAAINVLVGANVAVDPQNESSHSFGIVPLSKLNQIEAAPWRNAFFEGGGDPSHLAGLVGGQGVYSELLLLASGIQMAGPHLTPQSFSEALTSTTFPNPGAAEAPSYQATVGFPKAGAAMTRDFAGWWLAPGVNEGSTVKVGLAQAGYDWQNFCWVDLGRRHADDSWPTADHFRQGPCR